MDNCYLRLNIVDNNTDNRRNTEIALGGYIGGDDMRQVLGGFFMLLHSLYSKEGEHYSDFIRRLEKNGGNPAHMHVKMVDGRKNRIEIGNEQDEEGC